jgi:hypothetical protein
LYGLVALGFGLIMGVMKFVNIAHGSFIIIGGYIAYWLFTLLGIDPYLSIPLVMLGMFIMGLALYAFALAPLLTQEVYSPPGREQPQQAPEESALPCPVRPHDAHTLTLPHGETEVMQARLPRVIGKRKLLDFKHSFHSANPRSNWAA